MDNTITEAETSTHRERARQRSTGLHRLSVAGAVCTLALVFVGSTVTSNDAGMAFPDWPTVEGRNMFLYPPSEWVGDKLFEHVHRLAGATVGLVMIALAVFTQQREPRRWVRRLAWAMLAAVIVQGVMGGLRVTERSVFLAIVHGCFGQLFFCLTICMVLFTSRSWMERRVENGSAGRRLSGMCLATSAIVFGQLIAGAVYRHLGEGLAYHVVGAVVVTSAISMLLMAVSGHHRHRLLLMRLVKVLGFLLVVQLALGVAAYLLTVNADAARETGFWEWLVPSLHVAVGACILATSVALTASVGGQFAKSNSEAKAPAAPGVSTA